MVVVDAVDDPVQARADALVRFEVEDDPVQPVLEQRPHGVAPDRQAQGRQRADCSERLQANRATIAGTKMTTGTAGCTRESESRTLDSNIGGEARSTSVRFAEPSAIFSATSMLAILLPRDRRGARVGGLADRP